MFLHGQADRPRSRFSTGRTSARTRRDPGDRACARHGERQRRRSRRDRSLQLFPIALFAICDELGLATNDPRGLTVTGGLPYFGGAGNNYATHAIAEIVARMRSIPARTGWSVPTAGCCRSTPAGVYSSTPAAGRRSTSQRFRPSSTPFPDPVDIHARRFGDDRVVHRSPTGRPGRSGRDQPARGDRRPIPGQSGRGRRQDRGPPDGADEPLGARIFARSFGYSNRVTRTRDRMDALLPRPDWPWGCVRLRAHPRTPRRTRPRGDVEPPGRTQRLRSDAHVELEQVFNAYFADPDLWVAIITGAGDDAFCAGNDLARDQRRRAPMIPRQRLSGLTSRAGIDQSRSSPSTASRWAGSRCVLACSSWRWPTSQPSSLLEVK